MTAAWFGLLAGLVEGPGLLLFQRINWARWGPMVHVSSPIIWISPVVDLIFFLAIAVAVAAVARVFHRIPAFQVTVFLLSFLTVYDWSSLAGRLTHFSCFLLAVGAAVAATRWLCKHEDAFLRFGKRTIFFLAAAAILAGFGIWAGSRYQEHQWLANLPTPSPDAPNVLVLVVDTLRADHLSCYGYARQTTPNIDELARQGVLFENAIAPSSWSFPSHVSLLTGRYQFEHGMDLVGPIPVFGSRARSFGGYPTLGEVLEKDGYRTGAFSANRTYFSHDLGFGRGFLHFEDYFHSAADMFVRTLYGREVARIYLSRSDKSKPKRVLRWLGWDSLLDPDAEGSGSTGGALGVRKRASVVNHELLHWLDNSPRRPFFAFLNYFDVHSPYGVPPHYAKPAWKQDAPADQYDDGVKYDDDQFGQLMAALEKRGLAGNTIVVLTADHGEELGQHGLAAHGASLYRGEIHVPLILWYPGHVPAGARVATPVTNAALPATLMTLVERQPATEFPVPSLSGLGNSDQGAPDEAVLSEVSLNKYSVNPRQPVQPSVPTAASGPLKSLVTSQWHLIMHKKLGNQLYDWVHDPEEMHDLFYTSAGQAAALRLFQQLQGIVTRSSGSAERAAMGSAVALQRSTTGQRTSPVARENKALDDYYRFRANPGEQVTFEVRSHEKESAAGLQPVLAIENADGELLGSCRNASDDQIAYPGVADPTPAAFDDICVNEQLGSEDGMDSGLEILVPGKPASQVDLFVRVYDWNGRMGAGMNYELAVSRINQAMPAVKASLPVAEAGKQ